MKTLKDLLALPILPEAKIVALVAATEGGTLNIDAFATQDLAGCTMDELVLGSRILRAEGISKGTDSIVKLSPEYRDMIENSLMVEAPPKPKGKK